MTPNLETSLDRADELMTALLAEYETCLRSKEVSGRAVQLTHDVCERVRSVLDCTARRYWEVHVSPALTEADSKAAQIYFPIAKDVASLDSILGRWRWKTVRAAHRSLMTLSPSRCSGSPLPSKVRGPLKPRLSTSSRSHPGLP
jgi:hypothetical protein